MCYRWGFFHLINLCIGNHYGTPKPSKESTSSWRSPEGLNFPGAHPSSEGKRRRNRSNVEAMTAKHFQQEDKDDLVHSNGNCFCWTETNIKLQWKPINGIMDNGINRLMRSSLFRLTSPKLLFPTLCMLKLICLLLSVGYWNQFASAPKFAH